MASAVIDKWIGDAAEAHAASSTYEEYRAQQTIAASQRVLELMKLSIAEGSPKYVFALATGGEVEDIKAIALVTQEFFRIGEHTQLIKVQQMVATPAAGGHRHITELLRLIHKWAAGRLVTVSQGSTCMDYYKNLGFEPRKLVVTDLVRSEPGPEAPPGGEKFRMVPLKIDSVSPEDTGQHAGEGAAPGGARPRLPDAAGAEDGPAPRREAAPVGTTAVRHVPLEALAVIDRWSTGATTPLRSTLGRMNRTIAGGVPSYVFALATGDGVEDIQAMATVAAGGAQGGVDIHEVAAGPGAEGHDSIAELVQRIQGWAAARVTVAQPEEAADYYKSLGFDVPAVAGSGHGTGRASGAEGSRLIALSFDGRADEARTTLTAREPAAALQQPSPAADPSDLNRQSKNYFNCFVAFVAVVGYVWLRNQ